jgi:hypothetical protein
MLVLDFVFRKISNLAITFFQILITAILFYPSYYILEMVCHGDGGCYSMCTH